MQSIASVPSDASSRRKNPLKFDYEVLELERKLLYTNKRIDNIVKAVSMRLVQESFITEMSKLEDDRIQMGISILCLITTNKKQEIKQL